MTILAAMTTFFAAGCKQNTARQTTIDEATIRGAVEQITATDRDVMERGVRQVARLWRAEDGTAQDFREFCAANYIDDPEVRRATFERISFYLEGIVGYNNRMTLRLRWNTDLDTGPLLPVDAQFAAYSPGAHFTDDFYRNKIAFIIALNFPQLSLAEKEMLGDNRLAWAYARLGDLFTERIPAEAKQRAAEAGSAANVYISDYNIYMGRLCTDDGRQIFPDDMRLLSHWNLRDEIKSNYALGDAGLEKQRMTYRVMQRIIDQTIPAAVVNSADYDWNPFTNAVTRNGVPVTLAAEGAVRYAKMLDNFRAAREIDRHTGTTLIDRKFDEEMEIDVDTVEQLFDRYLSAPELRVVGALIAQRLGRPLEAHDIWYDGFKMRSTLDEDKLSQMTLRLFPTAEAFERAMPSMLVTLGFAPVRAKEIASLIAVDAARGSGHAWGAQMRGQRSHLRTRLTPQGMDYKGFNIAVHELGHNVEQTISLYDVDYWTLRRVPNTSFTEALAFIFQRKDLELLGIGDGGPSAEAAAMEMLDMAWGLFEICGVSMLDIAVWKWLYANPNVTAEQLRDQTILLSKQIWNHYFAPVFGVEDQTVLAVYSHMISNPLYLSNYAFGRIIEFQLDRHLSGRDFANEVDRIYRLGKLTPNAWMMRATGSPVSVEPFIAALREVVD